MASCQILIDFIQKENFNKNESIFFVIQKLPTYIEINESLKSFFLQDLSNKKQEKDFKMFSVNTLLNIYSLIETICWKQFKKNLDIQYKMHLSDNNKKEIKEYLEENITESSLIKTQDIADAVRRLISRYLSGKRLDVDIGQYNKLFDYIQRADLWKTDLFENE